MPTIGPMLREARTRRCLTQRDLAHKSGVSLNTIARMEQPEGYNCELDSVLAVVSALGVPLGAVIRHPSREGAWTQDALPAASKRRPRAYRKRL